MDGETGEANARQWRYWNEIVGPRWVASPGFRERRNKESLALLLGAWGLPAAKAFWRSAVESVR
jgi:hypothetical protein